MQSSIGTDDDPFVQYVAGVPGLAERLLAGHVADRSGRDCVECSGAVRAVRYPCVHRWHAEQALLLLAERRRRVSDNG